MDPVDFMRDGAIGSAHELGLFAALAAPQTVEQLASTLEISGQRRLQRLLDALVAIDVLVRERDRYAVIAVPERPTGEGGRLFADVMRNDRPLARERPSAAASAGALVPMLGESAHAIGGGDRETRHESGESESLLGIGTGAVTYTLEFLAAHPAARATLVDDAAAIARVRERFASVGDRMRFIEGDAREVLLGEEHDTALLANVLHLHGPVTCERLCDVAARAVVPGGRVIIDDVRHDEGRGVWLALELAIYTDDGDVHPAAQLREWLVRVGLIEVTQMLGDRVVVIGRRPEEDAIARQLDSALSRSGKVAWRELEADGRLRRDAFPRRLRFPAPLRRMLSRALAREDSELARQDAAALRGHYLELMPRLRVAQIVGTDEPAATLFHAELDWARLPRLAAALHRLFEVLASASIDCERALGAASARELRARTTTLAELYTRTYHGACMPLRYPADLAARGAGLDTHAIIDRYLTAPLVLELCHMGRDREALSVHLDECIASWLGVHVWPELAYLAPGEAIDPCLAQIGQAIVRAFGIAPVLRAHAGAATWRDALPASFVDAAQRLSWDDWRARRSLDFLSDQPRPWVALALAGGANVALADHTLASLAALPLAMLALRPDDAIDRAILEDGLRAMCPHGVAPDSPIDIDARSCRVTTVDRSYWLPPAIAARLATHGIAGYTLRLTELEAISAAADAISAASRGCEHRGFALSQQTVPAT